MTQPQAQRLEQLSAEAQYHRQRLDLYRARLYGGRALSPTRLEEFQRASDEAALRLRHEQRAASSTQRALKGRLDQSGQPNPQAGRGVTELS